MMKQIKISFLLTALLSMVGARALAYDFSVANADGVTIYYKWANNKTELSVSTRRTYSSNFEYSGNVVIPETVTYDGATYPVTSIGSSAFRSCSGLTSVTIPNSVTTIGEYAFSYCSSLTSVTIPNSVTSIGSSAFSGCSGLTSIVVETGNSKFDTRDNCNAIIETASNTLIAGCMNSFIPNTVTSIEYAFSGCSGLMSITIPNSVTSIGNNAFSGCSGLTSITIPNSVTSISDGAFSRCYFARENFVNNSTPSSDNNWGATLCDKETEDGLLINNNSVVKCREWANSVSIPNSVTSIDQSAFYGCSGLTNVTIPNSVTTIGNQAFDGCKGLTSVTIPNSVTSIGSSAFLDCSGLTSIVVETGNSKFDSRDNCNAIIKTASNTLIAGCMNSFIPNTVTSIDKYAFSGCSGLTSVTIPNSVTSIGYSAFSGCSGLTSIVVETGNLKFDSRDNCNAIIKTASNTLIAGCMNSFIPNTVTSIDSDAFSGCSGLTSVTIPNSVTSIGGEAFSGCSGLTSVNIHDSVTDSGIEINNWAFEDCTSLTTVTIGCSDMGVACNAFDGCTNLTSVISLHIDPPYVYISGGPMGEEIYINATLYVPKGCIASYRFRPFWEKFNQIEEIDVSAIEPTISTKKTQENWDVYNIKGERMKIKYNEMEKLPKGIYIVGGKKIVK